MAAPSLGPAAPLVLRFESRKIEVIVDGDSSIYGGDRSATFEVRRYAGGPWDVGAVSACARHWRDCRKPGYPPPVVAAMCAGDVTVALDRRRYAEDDEIRRALDELDRLSPRYTPHGCAEYRIQYAGLGSETLMDGDSAYFDVYATYGGRVEANFIDPKRTYWGLFSWLSDNKHPTINYWVAVLAGPAVESSFDVEVSVELPPEPGSYDVHEVVEKAIISLISHPAAVCATGITFCGHTK